MVSIEFKTVPIEELRKNPWNTNRVSAEHEAKIRRSIERNGLFKPIIVRTVPGVPGYEIVGGEHRWEQAVELGHTSIPIANLGEIDEVRAKEISVIDNARYGADDALSFADLLKEIGGADELQEFLPYGEADIEAIFSASNVDLDDLELDENFDTEPEKPEDDEAPAAKPPKTHTIVRFKVSLADAEKLTARIAATQKEQGFTGSDDLTNAGDALIHLLFPPTEDDEALEDLDYALADIEDEE